MKKEGLFDREANEANLELDEKMNEGQMLHGKAHSTAEANLKIQEAFYGEDHYDEAASTYINNNTPAIKITGNDK
jgi:hypothetical protein